ncbi:hypothetical protein EPN83_00185 [Patescibacteria group bacterium]|nr:MAG: hypothetical protein EPN83_00185 [Patescibacteria group bacterium]
MIIFLGREKRLYAKSLLVPLLVVTLALQTLGFFTYIREAAAAPVTIFSDGFENTPQFTNPLWEDADPLWNVSSSNAHSGTRKAFVIGNTGGFDDMLRQDESTVGYQNIVLTYWFRADDLESSQNDKVDVQWSPDAGVTWNTLFSIDDNWDADPNLWIQQTHSLPAGANNNPNFRFRFKAKLNTPNDKVYLDDVSLEGDVVPANLTVNKVVVNNNGGAKTVSDFPLFVNGQPVVSAQANQFAPGQYTVSETNQMGYTATIGGDCDAQGNVTLSSGDNKICTVTNDDVAPILTVVKVVDNGNNPHPKQVSDFLLFVDGLPVVSGLATTTPAGTHTVTETTHELYTSSYSPECPSGQATLLPGDNVTCTVTNTYTPPASTSTGAILITKFLCPGGTELSRDANGPAADGAITPPESCIPDPGEHFGYIHEPNRPNGDFSGPFPGLDDSQLFTVAGQTDANGHLEIRRLSRLGRYDLAEVRESGERIPQGPVLGFFCVGDTNSGSDNYDSTFFPERGAMFCAVYNEGRVEAPPEDDECNPTEDSVVSDSNTIVLEASSSPAAELSFIHPAWSATVGSPDARWIWEIDGVANPTTDEEKTFVRAFNLIGDPTGGSLRLASDNSYEARLNGQPVGSDLSENNFSSSDEWDVGSILRTGANELIIKVKNWALPEGTPQTNPAGLLYRLRWTGRQCGGEEEPPREDPGTSMIFIRKYIDGARATITSALERLFKVLVVGGPNGDLLLSPENQYQNQSTEILNFQNHWEMQEETTFLNGESNVIPAGGECSQGKFRLVGYTFGDSWDEAQSSAGTSTTDVILNSISSDKYIIVWNEVCPDDEDNGGGGGGGPTTGELIVTKIVENGDNPTPKSISDFSLFVFSTSTGTTTLTSSATSTLSAGDYQVSETIDPDYDAVIGGDCSSSGNVTVVAGQTKTCTITNTYAPAIGGNPEDGGGNGDGSADSSVSGASTGGGGGGGGSHRRFPPPPAEEVLGAFSVVLPELGGSAGEVLGASGGLPQEVIEETDETEQVIPELAAVEEAAGNLGFNKSILLWIILLLVLIFIIYRIFRPRKD